ncbi:hypothetical protein KJZ63_04170 [Patescibacteria group bacterium]|nr:hypothetical protein [Patescibacteria group bacterium]
MKKIDWQTRLFRITLFPTEALPPDMDFGETWEKVSELEPESRKIPREQKTIFIADIDDNKRIVNENTPTRIDWYFRTKEEINFEDFTFTSLGSWEENKEYILEVGSKVIKAVNFDIKRIAFGVVFFSPNNTLEQNQAILFEKLPVSLKPDNYTDFLFQINEPSEIKIGKDKKELRLNRLSKWGMLTLEGQKVSNTGEEQDLPIQNYCQIELDINTDKSNRETLSQNQLLSILEESVGSAEGMIDNGIKSNN